MTADQMGEALPPLGVDILYLLPFDAEMAGMTDAAFAERVLAEGLGIRHAAVGFDFTFGKGRSGSPEGLRAYGERLGFNVSTAPRLDDADGLKLSSSAVREALKAGVEFESETQWSPSIQIGAPVMISPSNFSPVASTSVKGR